MRRLVAGGLAAGLLAAAGLWALSRADLSDRLGRYEQVGNAYLQPAGPFQWPRMTRAAVVADCDLCASVPRPPAEGALTVLYGWLVQDEDLSNFSDNLPNQPHSAQDVPLPRLVWLAEWPDRCWRQPPAGFSRCTTYELIDDQHGWFLTGSQLWR